MITNNKDWIKQTLAHKQTADPMMVARQKNDQMKKLSKK